MSNNTFNWDLCLSIITVVVACYAIIQTKKQIKLSNKQELFENRMQVYVLILGLIQLYEKNHSIISFKEDTGPLINVVSPFEWLTNNTYLSDISSAIETPLEHPIHKEFLIKLEELKIIATKTTFLFPSKTSKILNNFILSYEELLFSMYQYQIRLIKIRDYTNDIRFNKTLEQSLKELNEEKERLKLVNSFSGLQQAYDKLHEENITKKVSKLINLN